jgi:hypothetical protein
VLGPRLDRGGRLLFPSFATGAEAMLVDVRKLVDRVGVRAGWKAGELTTRVFRHSWMAARLRTLDRGYTVAREWGMVAKRWCAECMPAWARSGTGPRWLSSGSRSTSRHSRIGWGWSGLAPRMTPRRGQGSARGKLAQILAHLVSMQLSPRPPGYSAGNGGRGCASSGWWRHLRSPRNANIASLLALGRQLDLPSALRLPRLKDC